MTTNRVSRWREMTGLDYPVLATLLFRGWSVLAGALTMLLLPFFISPIEQGYYYTFASILALQIFFELGLNQIIVQLVSHEVAHLQRTDKGQFEGPAKHIDQLSGLAGLLRRWYAVATGFFLLIAGTVGCAFFANKGTLPPDAWLWQWLALVLSTGINLWFSPQLALMEGCAMVGQVARLRLVQSCLGYFVLWVTLLLGFKLWATVAVPLTSVLATAYWLRKDGNVIVWLQSRAKALTTNPIRWREHVLPLQWRIALSWMCGYFIFYLFTPVLFATQGAAEAGRLGMSLALFNAILNVGMSWVNAKAPNFTMHIARGERQALNTLFKSVTYRSSTFTALACCTVVVMAWVMTDFGMSQMQRLSNVPVLACLAVVTVVNSVVFASAIYMRAYREEPMLWVSLVSAALIAPTTYVGARNGTLVMTSLYMGITVFISLPWTLLLLKRYYNKS